jgi:hypothetical protein
MRRTCRLLTVVGGLAIVPAGCSDVTAPGDQSNERIAIVNDEAALTSRVTYYDDEVPITSAGVGYPSLHVVGAPGSLAPAAPAAFRLRLKAEVAPPSIDGQVLQATSVAIVGKRAVVSYNMRGEPYLGAIDVFDISNRNRPVLRSQALFRNSDINAVTTFGNFVVAAEATGDEGFESPAVVEVMFLLGNYLVLNGNWRSSLSSYAATSVAGAASRAYATSGDDGALFVFDPNSSLLIDTIPLHDARWVAAGEGKVVVAQGTPGQISVFDESDMELLGTFPFPGADIAESKSTAELAGGKAFIAAGSGGVQILSTGTGAVVGSVPRPDPAVLGLDPAVVVTNAVSVDDDLLFIANGEAGVYVAQGRRDFRDTGSETSQQITMLGRLQFGSLQSVNHVAFRDDYLMIAAGLGGLKVVKIN